MSTREHFLAGSTREVLAQSRGPQLIRVTGIAVEIERILAVINHPQLAGNDILRDDSVLHVFAQFNLRFVLPKLASANQNLRTVRLNRRFALLITVPLDKSAVGQSHGSATGDFGNFIARSQNAQFTRRNTPEFVALTRSITGS